MSETLDRRPRPSKKTVAKVVPPPLELPSRPRPWQQACNDVVASTVHHILLRNASRLLFSEKLIESKNVNERAARTHARAVRSTIKECLPLAKERLAAIGHPKDKLGCRCRAYMLLQINAEHAASCHAEAQRIYRDSRARFDSFMDSRS